MSFSKENDWKVILQAVAMQKEMTSFLKFKGRIIFRYFQNRLVSSFSFVFFLFLSLSFSISFACRLNCEKITTFGRFLSEWEYLCGSYTVCINNERQRTFDVSGTLCGIVGCNVCLRVSLQMTVTLAWTCICGLQYLLHSTQLTSAYHSSEWYIVNKLTVITLVRDLWSPHANRREAIFQSSFYFTMIYHASLWCEPKIYKSK